jgi:hypothetical protein
MSDEQERPTFDDFLDTDPSLPSAIEADKLIDHLLRAVYDQEERGYVFTDVALTYRPPEDHDYDQIKNRAEAGGLQYGRVTPDIGFQPYWHPTNAPIPVVAFKWKEESGHTEWWTRTVHPRLVASGREEVMEVLVSWLTHEVRDTTARLERLLHWTSVLQETETLETMWPAQMNTEPGEEWDVEPNDHVPSVGDEEQLKRASERFAMK